jgi:hypothetical protein
MTNKYIHETGIFLSQEIKGCMSVVPLHWCLYLVFGILLDFGLLSLRIYHIRCSICDSVCCYFIDDIDHQYDIEGKRKSYNFVFFSLKERTRINNSKNHLSRKRIIVLSCIQRESCGNVSFSVYYLYFIEFGKQNRNIGIYIS